MQSSELPVRVEKLFLEGVKTEAVLGMFRECKKYWNVRTYDLKDLGQI